MRSRNGIRSRRGKRRLKRDFELQLTSLMDVLVIIVVFLLKSNSAGTNSFTTVPGLKLPSSQGEDSPPDSLQVIITPEGLNVDSERIAEFQQTDGSLNGEAPGYAVKKQDLDDENRRIRPLYDALVKSREKAETIKSRSGSKTPFEGLVAIQADKRVQYDTIRKIMYTSATAGFKVFRFIALKQDQ